MQRRVRIAASVGLHARPAALLAKAAAAQAAPVTIAKVVDGVAGDPVDASSMLGLMSLGAQHGEEVELSGDEAALDELVALLEQDLDKAPA
ncbi:HPr family phosphocarrier protein [Saccharopolyspora shandongensis]|uniref:HPr family phosphocarrier protein n=1 Tax=Saccharopolyspora shandongensis TaxID=418495 RepID=UPI0033EBE1C6